MRIGLLSYSNRHSGVGVFAWEFLRHLPVSCFFSVPSAKGQEIWTPGQVQGWPDPGRLEMFLQAYRPDVLLAIETVFDPSVYEVCRAHAVKTVLVTMLEAWIEECPDVFLCPTLACYEAVEHESKVYIDLPMEVEAYSFTQRRQAQRFLHVRGCGGTDDRRQTQAAVDGFLMANLPGATLTIHTQQPWQPVVTDPRVVVRCADLSEPAQVFDGFDVLLQPDAYAGFDRPLLEAMACGMPVITTDAGPMNEAVAIDGLVKSYPVDWRRGCPRNVVTAPAVAEALHRVPSWDVTEISRRCRALAESHGWTAARRQEWLEVLENS